MSLAPESAAAAELPGLMPEVPGDIGEGAEARRIGSRREIWRRFRRNRLALIGLFLVVVLVFLAIFGSILAPYNPTQPAVGPFRSPPSVHHWFGTDSIGHDIFSRVLVGARYSLEVGVLSAAIAVFFGILFGALAGYYGRWVDSLLMRLTDIFLAMPYIIIAIVLVVVFGRSMFVIIAVLGGLGWMPVARLFRSSILQVKEQDFIEAARALGCNDWRIITRHVIPNAIQPVIVYGTLLTGTAILSEAVLSFLNVGVQDPTPSWGLMVQEGQQYFSSAPHIVLFPCLAIFVTVIGFVFVGDGLRDALDPKLRK